MAELFQDYTERPDITKAVRLSKENLEDFVFRTNVQKVSTVYEDGVTTFTFEWHENHKRNPLVVKAGDYVILTESTDSDLEYHQRAQFTVVSWRDFHHTFELDEFVFSPVDISILKHMIEAYQLDPKNN